MSVQQQIDRINTEVSAQETLLDQALAAIANKAAGGGGGAEEKVCLQKIYDSTFTGDGSGAFKLNHNTGIVPLAIRISISGTASTYTLKQGMIIKTETTAIGVRTATGSSTSTLYGATYSYTPAQWDENAVSVSAGNTSYKFASGKTYDIELFA